MAMAIRWKLKFGNGEWPWPFSGNGIFGSVNGQILQVAIRHKKWPFVFLAIRLPGPGQKSLDEGYLCDIKITQKNHPEKSPIYYQQDGGSWALFQKWAAVFCES